MRIIGDAWSEVKQRRWNIKRKLPLMSFCSISSSLFYFSSCSSSFQQLIYLFSTSLWNSAELLSFSIIITRNTLSHLFHWLFAIPNWQFHWFTLSFCLPLFSDKYWSPLHQLNKRAGISLLSCDLNWSSVHHKLPHWANRSREEISAKERQITRIIINIISK